MATIYNLVCLMPNNRLRQLLLVITVSSSAYGFVGFDSHLLRLDYIGINGQQLAVIHPYLDDNHSRLPRFALYRHRLVDLAGYGELLLREAGLSYGVEIVVEQQDRRLVDYRYRWHGHDVCDLRASIHALRYDHQLYRRGQLPDIIGQPAEVFVWPPLDDVQWLVEQTFPADSQVQVIASRPCLLNSNHSLLPVYDLTVKVDNLVYEVRVASDEVLSVNSRFFHVQGEFFVYPENSIASSQRENFYIEVDGSGSLLNSNFKTVAYGNQQVQERDYVFNYQDGDPRLAQVSAFAHVNLMLEWFRGLGYRWQGERLLIEVHANNSKEDIHAPIRQFPNNALYMPQFPNSSSPPRIMLGDGDGESLKNLALDGDVISHELGHHVIYRRLTETKGQSLVIHEGLADYFTFAKTGNTCLAESVCPEGSLLCQPNKDNNRRCLRIGDHPDNYAQLASLGSPHMTGQVLSAFLWDLRTDDDIANDKIDRIAFEAIDYLQWDSNLRGFIEAILLADYQLYQGKTCSKILSAAVNRGLSEFANNLECNEDTPKIIEYNRASATTNTALRQEESQDSCGTITSLTMGNNSPLHVLLLIISPLFVVLGLKIYQIDLSSH